MRIPAALTGIGLVLLLACGEERTRRDEQPVRVHDGSSVPVGRWFGGDGREEFHVGRSGRAFTAAWLLPQEYPYRLTGAEARQDGLHLWIEGPDSRQEYRLRQVKEEIWSLTTVASRSGDLEHGYFLTRNPSPAWIAKAAAGREADEQAERLESLVDWLVQTL